jgi:hypothetical protein
MASAVPVGDHGVHETVAAGLGDVDSGVFFTFLSEVADTRFVGTALTAQTAIGFGLTTVSIQLVPVLAETTGWRYGFPLLAPFPFSGCLP